MAVEHEPMMREALRLAEQARGIDEVPVGAIVVQGELRLGQGHNQNILQSDPTAHAEIVALRDACGYADNYRLPEATIYVSLEPCLMCYMALVQARVACLVYGASDPKGGFSRFVTAETRALMNHQPKIVAGVLAEEASGMIRDFFKAKRQRGKRDWLKDSD